MRRLKCKIIACCMLFSLVLPAAFAAEPESDVPEVAGLSISMKISETSALMNGEAVALENAPFLLDNVPYVPLRETVERFGGIIAPTYMSKIISGALYALPERNDPENWCFSQIWMDNTDYMLNGSMMPHHTDDNYRRDYGVEQASLLPQIHNGRIFVPVHVMQMSGQIEVIWEPDDQRVILTMARNENGIPGFAVGSDFSGLDTAVKERFYPVDDAHPALGLEGYYEQTYTDGDIELVLGSGYREWPASRKEIRSVKLVTDRYSSIRGLRVGDSMERYEDLYGTTLTVSKDKMPIEVKDGRITSISFVAQSL